MHADRTNRFASVLLALVLLVGGVAVALLGFGAFGPTLADTTVIDNAVSAYAGNHGHWFWLVAAVLSVGALLLCVRWIIVILTSTDRADDLTMADDRSPGRTVLAADAVTGAVANEVAGYPGVASASARLIDSAGIHDLVLQVRLDQAVNIVEVRRLIDTQAVAHVRQAIDDEQLPVTVELTMVGETGTRVR